MSASSSDLTPTSSRSETETPPSSTSSQSITALGSHKASKAERVSRWRPSYHVQPTTPSWMNDPCAPFYDDRTGLYHVSFQWNPNGADWGDISWGSAISPDLIHWTYQETPSLSPDQSFDHKGVFTGCFIPSRNGDLVYVYTSVSQLPIHHTLPHARGSESLSLAISKDNGRVWRKREILPSEPEDLEVTGWRDPFVGKWPRLANLLDLDRDTSFGIVSGGIRDKTPTTFLYAIDPVDITMWSYVGPLANFGLNYTPSRWSGDLGRNWEVSNFLTLIDEHDSGIQRDFVVCGTEGCVQQENPSHVESLTRPPRQQLWFSGQLEATDNRSSMGPVEMKYKFGGYFDHGNLYAANSFFDPKSNKHIVWGWIGEEDLSDDLRHAQGWSGMLSMPREIRLATLRHVSGTVSSDLSAITSVEADLDQYGSYTLRTLISQPYQPLIEALRSKTSVRRTELPNTSLMKGIHTAGFDARAVQTTQWELDAMFDVSQQAHHIGIIISHSPDDSRATTLSFDQTSETFLIQRPALDMPDYSTLINSSPEIAPHTLFYKRDPVSGIVEKEKLRIRAWRDNSVLEVFVNERTAISTRLYAADETFGMRFFVDDQLSPLRECMKSALVFARLWDGIGI